MFNKMNMTESDLEVESKKYLYRKYKYRLKCDIFEGVFIKVKV